ncbi:hypothetical protein JOF29_001597 [Kribbella aluminosa]|uniref:Integrase SAM-like N-terminal domain-containing protein n=1 Tax=Kribbella aluminosa TaxID=416017 RepID=A0ABS4UG25_9ACTN|nr:hypothetical protein [Kribbella aluminosa]
MRKINHLIDLWIAKFTDELVADRRRSPNSRMTYLPALKNHLRPALGELRIAEATIPRIDRVIGSVLRFRLRLRVRRAAGSCASSLGVIGSLRSSC